MRRLNQMRRFERLRQQRYREWVAHQYAPRTEAETEAVEAAVAAVSAAAAADAAAATERVHQETTQAVLFGALTGAERALAAGDSLAHSTHAIVDRALAAAAPAPALTPPPAALHESLTLYFGSSAALAAWAFGEDRGDGGGGGNGGVAAATFATWPAAKAGGAETTCAVCLEGVGGDGEADEAGEPATVVFPGCGHAFHRPCLWAWVQHHGTCPVCRATPPAAT